MDKFILKKRALKLVNRFYRKKKNTLEGYITGVNSEYLESPFSLINV